MQDAQCRREAERFKGSASENKWHTAYESDNGAAGTIPVMKAHGLSARLMVGDMLVNSRMFDQAQEYGESLKNAELSTAVGPKTRAWR